MNVYLIGIAKHDTFILNIMIMKLSRTMKYVYSLYLSQQKLCLLIRMTIESQARICIYWSMCAYKNRYSNI